MEILIIEAPSAPSLQFLDDRARQCGYSIRYHRLEGGGTPRIEGHTIAMLIADDHVSDVPGWLSEAVVHARRLGLPVFVIGRRPIEMLERGATGAFAYGEPVDRMLEIMAGAQWGDKWVHSIV